MFKLENIPFHFSARVRSSIWLDNINRSFFGPLRASSGIDAKIDQKKYLFPRLDRIDISNYLLDRADFFRFSAKNNVILTSEVNRFLFIFGKQITETISKYMKEKKLQLEA